MRAMSVLPATVVGIDDSDGRPRWPPHTPAEIDGFVADMPAVIAAGVRRCGHAAALLESQVGCAYLQCASQEWASLLISL